MAVGVIRVVALASWGCRTVALRGFSASSCLWLVQCCVVFLRVVRKVVSPPRVSAASVVQPTPVHTHRDESPCELCVPVGVAVLVVDWRAVGPVAGPVELFLREVMVKPVMG